MSGVPRVPWVQVELTRAGGRGVERVRRTGVRRRRRDASIGRAAPGRHARGHPGLEGRDVGARARRRSETAASATSRTASAPPTSPRCSARGRRAKRPGGRRASRGTGVRHRRESTRDSSSNAGSGRRTRRRGARTNRRHRRSAVLTGSAAGRRRRPGVPPLLPPVAPEPSPPVMFPSQPPSGDQQERRHDVSTRATRSGTARRATTLSSVHLSASARAGEQTPHLRLRGPRRSVTRPRTVRDHRPRGTRLPVRWRKRVALLRPGLGSAAGCAKRVPAANRVPRPGGPCDAEAGGLPPGLTGGSA